MPLACIWCGTRPTNKEHVFPKWLSNVLPRMPKTLLNTTNMRLTSSGTQNVWPGGGASPELTAKVACEACNGGWMGRIESAAIPLLEPMILGEQVILTPGDQNTIATWACLKSIVARGIHEPYLLPEQEWLTQFYETRTLPDSWRVWLSAYDGQNPTLYDGYDIGDVHLMVPDGGSQPTSSASERHGLLATFVIGYFAVKVFGIRRPDADDPLRPDAFLRIFPTGETVSWPPPMMITDESLSEYLGLFLRNGSVLGQVL